MKPNATWYALDDEGALRANLPDSMLPIRSARPAARLTNDTLGPEARRRALGIGNHFAHDFRRQTSRQGDEPRSAAKAQLLRSRPQA